MKRNEKPYAIAKISVANANKLIAVKNSPRVVKRSIKKAVIGIIIPLTSIKIDCNHWTVLSLICKSCIIGGSAVPNNVWFKIVIKAPDSNTAINGIFRSEERRVGKE